MPEQKIVVGRIVKYTLSDEDAEKINRRRTNGGSIAERMQLREWPVGAQAHIGGAVSGGQILPMMVTNVTVAQEDTAEGTKERTRINGQVFLDGTDVYWAVQREEGTHGGAWHWPTRD
jgi:hypothetical protein